MAKVDPRDFLLNTDYEMDKIILFKKGTLNAGDYNIDIPHNLPFTPLIFGVCAYNEDFSDSKNVPYQYITQSNTESFTATANGSVIRMQYTNYSGTPNKIYYRLYGFEPSGSRAKVGSTSKYAKNFILNTDYNYCKLFKKGTANAGDTIDHNLGYVPQTLAWMTANGWTSPIDTSSTTDRTIVTESSLIFQYQPLGIDKFHYRIYYDEA